MQIDVDSLYDSKRPELIQYIGTATRLPNGNWKSLANVCGALCIVEFSILEVPEPLVWEGDNS